MAIHSENTQPHSQTHSAPDVCFGSKFLDAGRHPLQVQVESLTPPWCLVRLRANSRVHVNKGGAQDEDVKLELPPKILAF